jgi:FAD/FMN-containing dehydrogenase
MVGAWEDPGLSDAATHWARSTWSKLEPLTSGFYVNVTNEDTAGRVRQTYGVNYERMVALKTKVDPNNLFRMNANVAPRAAAKPA